MTSPCLRTPGSQPVPTENHTEINETQALWVKRMSNAYIRVKEVRGQVPGTTCNGARTNSAINNSQNSGYLRAPEYYAVHGGSGAPGLRHQAPRAVDLLVLRTWPIGQELGL